jgi:hypothetical protein
MALDAALTATNCAQNPVVLNEVFANNQTLTNALGRTPDWVELVNTTTNTVDVSDLSLTDEPSLPRKWVFPAGSVIGPGAHLVIECDDALLPSATNTGFALSASGDAVY